MFAFYPNSNNSGGKSIISSQKIKHVLSVLNTKPSINSLKKPHPHINGTIYNKKKGIEIFNEFREVQESFKRVGNLKKGYVNNTPPHTFHLKNTISKRIGFEKNIVLHDHMRNINHLVTSLTEIDKKYDKKFRILKNNSMINLKKNNITKNSSFIMGNTSQIEKNHIQSIDYLGAENIINAYDPNNQRNKVYDSSLPYKKKLYPTKIYQNVLTEKTFERKKTENNIINTEINNSISISNLKKIKNNVDLMKKEVLKYIVEKKIRSKDELLNLKYQLQSENNIIDNTDKWNNIFEELENYFFK